jgi:hypothetical protein
LNQGIPSIHGKVKKENCNRYLRHFLARRHFLAIALNVWILEYTTFFELEVSRFNKLHHIRGFSLLFIAGFLTYGYG